MNTKAILSQVEKLHANAKSGGVTIDKVGYLLTFNGHSYDVTQAGAPIVTFNTRKLSQCKQWLREWLAN